MIVPVIMTGGKGERLWPVSTPALPKPFFRLGPDQPTLLQQAVRRAMLVPDAAAPVFVCNALHQQQVREQAEAAGLSSFTLLVEPAGRDTAAAICAAALLAVARGQGDDPLLVLAADHVIQDNAAFVRAVAEGAVAARQGHLVTFAIPATHPATGYGYLHLQEEQGSGLTRVARFVEKPERAQAERFLASGRYGWNSGMFMFQPRVILAAFEQHLPDLLRKVRASLPDDVQTTSVALRDEPFCSITPISIDKGIMEHAQGIVAVRADIGWSDVGDWESVWQVSAQDENEMVVAGHAIAIDSSSSLLRSEGPLLVGIGLYHMVAVATADGVLVAPRSRTQDVKLALAALRQSNLPAATREQHGWGSRQLLAEGTGFKVFRYDINPATAGLALADGIEIKATGPEPLMLTVILLQA